MITSFPPLPGKFSLTGSPTENRDIFEVYKQELPVQIKYKGKTRNRVHNLKRVTPELPQFVTSASSSLVSSSETSTLPKRTPAVALRNPHIHHSRKPAQKIPSKPTWLALFRPKREIEIVHLPNPHISSSFEIMVQTKRNTAANSWTPYPAKTIYDKNILWRRDINLPEEIPPPPAISMLGMPRPRIVFNEKVMCIPFEVETEKDLENTEIGRETLTFEPPISASDINSGSLNSAVTSSTPDWQLNDEEYMPQRQDSGFKSSYSFHNNDADAEKITRGKGQNEDGLKVKARRFLLSLKSKLMWKAAGDGTVDDKSEIVRTMLDSVTKAVSVSR